MKIRMTWKRRRGLTLVELLVAILINLIGIVAIMSVFMATSRMVAESYFRNKAAQEARFVVDKLTADAREAITTESSYGAYNTSTSSTLILKVPAITAAGLPVDIHSKFDYIIYHKAPNSADKLMRTVIADATSSRANEQEIVGQSVRPGVYAVQPDPTGNFVVYYQFVSVQTFRNRTIEITSGGSVYLRNHV